MAEVLEAPVEATPRFVGRWPRWLPAVDGAELRHRFYPVCDDDVLACPRCGADHSVLSIDGEPRLQVVRCGTRLVPVGLENRRIA